MTMEIKTDNPYKTYIGEDGLLHCAVCGGALQKRLSPPVLGMTIRRATCKCQEECFKKKQAEEKARQHEITMNDYRSVCFHEKRMYQWTFENDNGSTPAMTIARKYVDNWANMQKDSLGMILWGNVGTGKTYMAACIANALIDREYRVLMTDFATISNISVFDSNEYLDSLSRYDLLILDDYGSERNTEFALQNVFDVINRRYESGKPLIVTTNLEPDNIFQSCCENLTRRRIHDRIYEMCIPIRVDGESKRTASGDRKSESFITLFS